MTDEPQQDGPRRAWWQAEGEGPPDIEALLGPDAMQAVGGVAEEALKLFVVLRDRFAAAGGPAVQAAQGSAPQWGSMLATLASSAVRAVNDLAVQVEESPAGQGDDAPGAEAVDAEWSGEQGAGPVLPGQAAACSYCPFCQAIALFRSVPATTWQRLATSIVEVADAAREFADSGPGHGPVVVQAKPASDGEDADGSLEEFLAGIEQESRASSSGDERRSSHPPAGLRGEAE